MGYVNGNIAREIGRLHRWAGPFWGRRARPIPCLDDHATIDRLRYCIAQGTKEGLVPSPLLWPGASSTNALLDNMIVTGEWVDRDKLRPARRAAERKQTAVSEADHTHNISFQLTPLPCWSKLDHRELHAKHQALVDEIVNDTKEARGQLPFLGVSVVLGAEPHDAPRESARSPAPLCHATTEAIRSQFRRGYALFKDVYRKAAALARVSFDSDANRSSQTSRDAKLVPSNHIVNSAPPGCYLTAMCFIPQRPSVLRSIVRLPDG
jgi:hypothetical protein